MPRRIIDSSIRKVSLSLSVSKKFKDRFLSSCHRLGLDPNRLVEIYLEKVLTELEKRFQQEVSVEFDEASLILESEFRRVISETFDFDYYIDKLESINVESLNSVSEINEWIESIRGYTLSIAKEVKRAGLYNDPVISNRIKRFVSVAEEKIKELKSRKAELLANNMNNISRLREDEGYGF